MKAKYLRQGDEFNIPPNSVVWWVDDKTKNRVRAITENGAELGIIFDQEVALVSTREESEGLSNYLCGTKGPYWKTGRSNT